MKLLEANRLLTVGEVALHLRQSERTVRDKIAAGDLPAHRIGSGPRAPIRVDRAELEAWLYNTPPRGSRAPDGATPQPRSPRPRAGEDAA